MAGEHQTLLFTAKTAAKLSSAYLSSEHQNICIPREAEQSGRTAQHFFYLQQKLQPKLSSAQLSSEHQNICIYSENCCWRQAGAAKLSKGKLS